MLFAKRATIDDEELAWQVETWRWLDGVLGQVDAEPRRDLITPDRTWMPDATVTGHDRALHYFELVRARCGMQEWPCDLVAQEPTFDPASSLPFYDGKSQGAAGTFGIEGNRIVITYAPSLVGQPIPLVATFVHELAHYLLLNARDEPPGGIEAMEPATDLATVHLGFGLFGANSAFNFAQFTDFDRQGWRTSRQGYLSEREWSFAIALFCEILAVAPETYKGFVKETIAAQIAKNRAYLKANPGIVRDLRQPRE